MSFLSDTGSSTLADIGLIGLSFYEDADTAAAQGLFISLNFSVASLLISVILYFGSEFTISLTI